MTVRVLPDANGAARAAATHIAGCVRRVAGAGHRCALALAGGSTPRDAYRMLAGEALPWVRVNFFLTDERMVPPGHPDSNAGMLRDALLAHVPVPAANVHSVHGELRIHEAAERYERELKNFFGGPPLFHLVLLGLGSDAHTASLFPFDPLIFERTVNVGASRPRADRGARVSLTVPAINSAHEAVFLVTGKSKANAVRKVVQGARDPVRLPAQFVATPATTWILDRDAASELQD